MKTQTGVWNEFMYTVEEDPRFRGWYLEFPPGLRGDESGSNELRSYRYGTTVTVLYEDGTQWRFDDNTRDLPFRNENLYVKVYLSKRKRVSPFAACTIPVDAGEEAYERFCEVLSDFLKRIEHVAGRDLRETVAKLPKCEKFTRAGSYMDPYGDEVFERLGRGWEFLESANRALNCIGMNFEGILSHEVDPAIQPYLNRDGFREGGTLFLTDNPMINRHSLPRRGGITSGTSEIDFLRGPAGLTPVWLLVWCKDGTVAVSEDFISPKGKPASQFFEEVVGMCKKWEDLLLTGTSDLPTVECADMIKMRQDELLMDSKKDFKRVKTYRHGHRRLSALWPFRKTEEDLLLTGLQEVENSKLAYYPNFSRETLLEIPSVKQI